MNKLQLLFDIFFCKHCIACDKVISLFSEKEYCDICNSNIVELQVKDFTLPNISKVKSLYLYDGSIKKALIGFKYKNNAQVGRVLGKKLADKLKKDKDYMSADIVINIPNGKYHTERYYNQSEFLAKIIAKNCCLKFIPNALKKKQNIKSQLKCKTSEERKSNIKNAFSLTRGTNVNGKKIILIDDITTTGATLSECAKTLLQAGAKTVLAATIARTSKKKLQQLKFSDSDITFSKRPSVHYKFHKQ